eukprot:scaffold195503_cov19-Tisochrysis_lutea.AAC.1
MPLWYIIGLPPKRCCTALLSAQSGSLVLICCEYPESCAALLCWHMFDRGPLFCYFRTIEGKWNLTQTHMLLLNRNRCSSP